MNGQIKQYGTISIPDYKIDAFLHDVRQVADQAGLLAIRHMRAYDEEFDLLCFPGDNGGGFIFNYSYFEDAVHDKVTIDVKTGEIHSSNLGFGKFGEAVQALYMLSGLYCEMLCLSDNCDEIIPFVKLCWLSYVLCRTITLQYHITIWDVYEQFVRYNGVNNTLSAMDFFNSYEGDETNFDTISTIVYVNDAINEEYIENCLKQKEPDDKSSYAFWVQSMARFLWLAKRDSMKSEKELLSHYIKLLHNVSKIREEIAAGVDVSPVKELFATVAPPITVKLISIIYGLDFWKVWEDNKDKIGVTSSIFYINSAIDNRTEDQNVNFDPITTEEFFGVQPEDRLYWWKEDGDVVIDSETRKWLEQMAEQHKVHVDTMSEEFSAVEWHERLVKILGKHNDKIKIFETLYCDFLNSFHKKDYRAWIEMLEVLADNDITDYRRLISVLANQELREKVFGV